MSRRRRPALVLLVPVGAIGISQLLNPDGQGQRLCIARALAGRRVLAPNGVLALVWNQLDVTIPWVHRLARIMHAGNVLREGFRPATGEGVELHEHLGHARGATVGIPYRTDLFLYRAG